MVPWGYKETIDFIIPTYLNIVSKRGKHITMRWIIHKRIDWQQLRNSKLSRTKVVANEDATSLSDLQAHMDG